MGNWSADITNDPDNDYNLYVELMEDEEYRASLFRDKSGKLQLKIYKGSGSVIPVDWLLGIIQRFTEDTESAEEGQE